MMISISLFLQCSNGTSKSQDDSINTTNSILVDSLASEQTVALFKNLQSFTKDRVLFGHQETTAYGVGWVNDGFGNKSDVKEVCGDFPAVYGWDIGDIEQGKNVDGVPFSQINSLIKGANKRGGINTISIHQDNPVTGGDAWDATEAVPHILPGGSHHDKYLQRLDLIAEFLTDLKADNGTLIPVILRPYHEHNGDWFWWCKGPSREEDYIAMWRMTVNYLRDEKGVHNVLYAISPDRSRMGTLVSTDDYFYAYPGDEYVDILGFDNYHDLGSHWNQAPVDEQAKSLVQSLEMIVQLADERNKIAALTETGLEKLNEPGWYTQRLLAGLNANENTRKVAYVQVWRNANTNHFFVPYPGHSSVADFISFYNDPLTVFESDLPNMYK